jgi:hypothetical protein
MITPESILQHLGVPIDQLRPDQVAATLRLELMNKAGVLAVNCTGRDGQGACKHSMEFPPSETNQLCGLLLSKILSQDEIEQLSSLMQVKPIAGQAQPNETKTCRFALEKPVNTA